MKNTMKIYYDDDPYSIISKVNDLISSCGIEIIEGDSDDGWVEYEVIIHDQKGEEICE